MKANLQRLDPHSYPHKLEVATRFSDVDQQNHLNNVRLLEYYQEARISFHRELRSAFEFERAAGTRMLVAHQSVDYLGEVSYPGVVTMGVGVQRIGNSSYSLGLAMFQDDRCVGTSTTVLVYSSNEGPTALPPHLREILQSRLLPEGARA